MQVLLKYQLIPLLSLSEKLNYQKSINYVKLNKSLSRNNSRIINNASEITSLTTLNNFGNTASLIFASTSVIFTILCTLRFLMTCFPVIERQKNNFPWLLISLPLLPFLNPLRKTFNYKDGRGLDPAPIALLSIFTLIQELTYGTNGLLLQSVNSSDIQSFLQSILILEKGILLSSWLLIAFRNVGFI